MKSVNFPRLKKVNFPHDIDPDLLHKIEQFIRDIDEPYEFFEIPEVSNILNELKRYGYYIKYYQINRNRGILTAILHNAIDKIFQEQNFILLGTYISGNIYIGRSNKIEIFRESIIESINFKLNEDILKNDQIHHFIKTSINSNIVLISNIISLKTAYRIFSIVKESKKDIVILKAIIRINQTIRNIILKNYVDMIKKYDRIEKRFFGMNFKNIKHEITAKKYKNILNSSILPKNVFNRYKIFINELKEIFKSSMFPKLYENDFTDIAELLLLDIAHPINNNFKLSDTNLKFLMQKDYAKCTICGNYEPTPLRKEKICRLCYLEKLLRGNKQLLIIVAASEPHFYFDTSDLENSKIGEMTSDLENRFFKIFSKNMLYIGLSNREKNIIEKSLFYSFAIYMLYNKKIKSYRLFAYVDYLFGVLTIENDGDFTRIYNNDLFSSIIKRVSDETLIRLLNILRHKTTIKDITSFLLYDLITKFDSKHNLQLLQDIKYIKKQIVNDNAIKIAYKLGEKLADISSLDNFKINISFNKIEKFSDIFPELDRVSGLETIKNEINKYLSNFNNLRKIDFAKELRTSFYITLKIQYKGGNL